MMDENCELQKKLEDILQELHTTKQNLALKQHLESLLEEEWEEVEKAKKLAVEEASKRKTSRQLQEVECEIYKKQMIIDELNDRIAHLEHAQNKQTNKSISESFHDQSQQEQHSFNTEVFRHEEENVNLKVLVSDVQNEIDELKNDISSLERESAEKDDMIERMRCQLASNANSLEKVQMQIIEQNMELEEMKMVASKPAPKGNSACAELDDRRVASEKMLETLQSHLKTIQEKYIQEHKNNYKLKMQILMMQPRCVEVETEANRDLRLQKIRSDHELATLSKKLEYYEQAENELLEKVCEILESTHPNSEKKKIFSDFLQTMLKNQEKQTKEAMAELRSQSIVYSDLNSSYLEKERDNILLENKHKKLQSQIRRLNSKIEELLDKYEPVEDEFVHIDEKVTDLSTEMAVMEINTTQEISEFLDKENVKFTLPEKENLVEIRDTDDSLLEKRDLKKGVIHVNKKFQKPVPEPNCKIQ